MREVYKMVCSGNGGQRDFGWINQYDLKQGCVFPALKKRDCCCSWHEFKADNASVSCPVTADERSVGCWAISPAHIANLKEGREGLPHAYGEQFVLTWSLQPCSQCLQAGDTQAERQVASAATASGVLRPWELLQTLGHFSQALSPSEALKFQNHRIVLWKRPWVQLLN